VNGLIFLSDKGRQQKEKLGASVMTPEDIPGNQDIQADLFVVDARSPDFATRALAEVRQSSQPEVYLLPVVLMGEEAALPPRIIAAADKVISRNQLTTPEIQKLRDEFASCSNRLNAVQRIDQSKLSSDGQAVRPDSNLGVKILRFLYVRSEEAVPVRGVWSSIFGYHYPKIAMFLESEDTNIFKMLQYLESQALLQGRFHDKAHSCARCSCNFLNFREICPHCQSADLAIEDLVHHFRCGHVAPEPEFKASGDMLCPKCSRALKSLGTDYDKPSLVYTCNDCGHTFQEPDISTICYNCEHTASPEEQINATIKSYRLTSLGENAAKHGLDSLFKEVLTEKMHVVDLDTFKVFLELERNRIKRYRKSASSLIYFSILNLGSLPLELGDQARAVFRDLSEVVAANLRNTDVISPLNDSTYLALLMETPLEGAQTARKRLAENITELLRANVKLDAEVKTHAFALTGQEEAKELLTKAMDHVNAG
jgi:hypothetical protein